MTIYTTIDRVTIISTHILTNLIDCSKQLATDDFCTYQNFISLLWNRELCKLYTSCLYGQCGDVLSVLLVDNGGDILCSHVLNSRTLYSICCVSICLSCVGAKNTTQSLLRDIGQCCMKVPLPSISAMDTQVLQCSKPVAKCALH